MTVGGIGLLELLSWALLTAGGAFVFIGGIGALRLPDLYTRVHAASVTDTLGTLCIIGGLMLQTGLSLTTLKVGAVGLFLLFTSPTSAYALSNAAFTSGCPPRAERIEAPEEA